LGFDAKDSPIVKELPKLGIPNQIVKYNGKDYIADKNGKFKPIGVKERKTKSKKPKSEPKPKPKAQKPKTYGSDLDPKYKDEILKKELTIKQDKDLLKDYERFHKNSTSFAEKGRLEYQIRLAKDSIKKRQEELADLNKNPRYREWTIDLIEKTIKERKTIPKNVRMKMPEKYRTQYNAMLKRKTDYNKALGTYQSKKVARNKVKMENREKNVGKSRKALLKAKNKFFTKTEVYDDNEEIISDINGMHGIMDASRISLLTTPEMFKGSFLDKQTKTNKTKIDYDPDEFEIYPSGDRYIVSNDGKNAYPLDKVQRIVKKMDNDTLEIYYGKGTENGSPLIIRDKNFVFATAPRVEEDDPDFEGGVKPERSKDWLISKKEYKDWMDYQKDDLMQLVSAYSINDNIEYGKGVSKGRLLYDILSFKGKHKDLYLKSKKEVDRARKLKGSIKGSYTFVEPNDNFPEMLKDEHSITALMYNKDFDNSALKDNIKFSEYKEHNFLDSKLSMGREKYLYIKDKTVSYKYDKVDQALKELNNPKLLYKKDHPLLIKGDNRTMLIAPKIQEEDNEEHVIPIKEFKRLNKLTRKELANQVNQKEKDKFMLNLTRERRMGRLRK